MKRPYSFVPAVQVNGKRFLNAYAGDSNYRLEIQTKTLKKLADGSRRIFQAQSSSSSSCRVCFANNDDTKTVIFCRSCERRLCTKCSKKCENCNMESCDFCCTIDYSGQWERHICVGCRR